MHPFYLAVPYSQGTPHYVTCDGAVVLIEWEEKGKSVIQEVLKDLGTQPGCFQDTFTKWT
jgi:hypothetical protein